VATASDQFVALSYVGDTTLTPADTFYVYTALFSGKDGTNQAAISANVYKARKWLVRHILPMCVTSCCVGQTGNVNGSGSVDLADLSALVSYLTGGGFTPPCNAEANINKTGGIDLADLSALVNYLTGGGFTLPGC
jgi:hypothetical protein